MRRKWISNRFDLTGRKFGRLAVIELSERPRDREETLWKCQCSCGNICDVWRSSLTTGNTKSCGCLKIEVNATRRFDLIGEAFGRLTVIGLSRVRPIKNGYVYWECRCICGEIRHVSTSSLRSGQHQSCGCLTKDKAAITGRKKRLPDQQAAKNNLFYSYVRKARKRTLDFQLTREQFFEMVFQDCTYCGSSPSSHTNDQLLRNGVDRVDSGRGYTVDNCVPCCKFCNLMKRNYTPEFFLAHTSKITTQALLAPLKPANLQPGEL